MTIYDVLWWLLFMAAILLFLCSSGVLFYAWTQTDDLNRRSSAIQRYLRQIVYGLCLCSIAALALAYLQKSNGNLLHAVVDRILQF